MREFFTHYWVKGFGWETTVYQKETFDSVEKLGKNETDGIIFIAFDKNENSYILKGYYAKILIESE